MTTATRKCDCGQEAAIHPFEQPMCWKCYRDGGGTVGVVPASTEAEHWFNREMDFAIDAHGMTDELEAALQGIFRNRGDDEPAPTREEIDALYAKAAQTIACTRGTCGWPERDHEHQPIA